MGGGAVLGWMNERRIYTRLFGGGGDAGMDICMRVCLCLPLFAFEVAGAYSIAGRGEGGGREGGGCQIVQER